MAEATQRTWWLLDRERSMRIADGLAAALAFSLPLSTSASGILAALWLIAVLPALDRHALRRVFATPAGYLPVLLWFFGLVGMLWAEGIPLMDRLDGLRPFHKLLFIPLLMAHFSCSQRGHWVLYGFLAGCSLVLTIAWAQILMPSLQWRARYPAGIPFKDHIAQSTEFTICIFLLARMALDRWREDNRRLAIAFALLALLFLADIPFLGTRTALVVIPALFVLFVAKHLSWKGTAAVLLAAVVVAAPGWWSSPTIQQALPRLWNDVRTFTPEGPRSSARARLSFWMRSIDFISNAPVIGHGTGSIPEQFRRSAEGRSGVAAVAAENPHQQTFAVAIQLGLAGVAVLWAMWAAHLLAFRGPEMVAWAGLVVSAQNVVGSLFNSHLFDFTHGWIYVVGVGVAAGVILQTAQVHSPGSSMSDEQR
jgi:O-antigen ligase